MTLHKTVDVTRKFLIGVFIGVAAIFVFMLIFRLGVIIKNIISPPKVMPANHSFGILPALVFPQNATSATLTYELNTLTGTLPEFPDRLNIYAINNPQPSLVNLNKAKEIVKKIGFVNEQGTVFPEISLGNETYAWMENRGLGRRITFDIVTFDFSLESNFLSSPTILELKQAPAEDNAVSKIKEFLNLLELNTDDVDLSKTKSELFSIQNSALMPETNISRAKIIRVNLHQKDIEYNLNTGIPDLSNGFKKTKLAIPIVYSNPPYTTMSFWLTSEDLPLAIVGAEYLHKMPNLENSDNAATYYIKTPEEAFEELKTGKAYIASYKGPETKIAINNVYLAYYIDEKTIDYLMPVIVFEGDGFSAYVPAVRTEWVK